MDSIKKWQHIVQYYETDQMAIVHHSNYIRWFEEARSWMLEEIGFNYAKMEEVGVIVPVLEVQASYKSMVRYGETVEISAKVKEFSGVKMVLSYEVKDMNTGELRSVGETKHAFLDKETYRPLSLKRKHTQLYKLFNELLEGERRKENE